MTRCEHSHDGICTGIVCDGLGDCPGRATPKWTSECFDAMLAAIGPQAEPEEPTTYIMAHTLGYRR